MNNPQSASHPILILIRGLPGSGKSYISDALKEALGKDNVVTLDPDGTDYTSKAYTDMSEALTAEGVDAKFHPYRFLRAQAYQGITANKVIIWNQAFTNLDGFQKTINNLQAYAVDHGTELPLLVVEVSVNEATAKARVAGRAGQGGHDVTEENFARFISEYRSFADEGFNTVAVNGEDLVTDSVYTIVNALIKLQ